MEVVVSLLGTLVAEPARLLCGSIYSNIKTTFKLKSNLNALDQKMKILIDLRNDIKEELQLAEEEGQLAIQIKEWLSEVQGIELEVNTTQADVIGNSNFFCWGCSNCCLSGEVAKKLEEVERLLKVHSSLAGVVAVNYKLTAVEHIPGPSIENQTTASKNLGKIMDLLNDDEVRRIGVWGMGGVGKTALVKNLNNKLKSESSNKPFSVVIWATVSRELDYKKIQTQIAERLKLQVKLEESVEGMARRLYRRLEMQKKFLLILDDVWETIDLDTLGVPQPEVHEGSNIMLTTRFLDVYREMKADVHVTVDVLSDEESWQLFCQNAGEVANSRHIKPIAEAVARECSGLPLAIITVGTAMRGKEMVKLWKDVLNELQRSEPNISGIERKLFKPLKWSYDSLQGKNIKPCFLYCCLYPEDYSIEVSELIQCWGAEGLIDEQENYEHSLNRGNAIVENLKDSCLLEHGIREGTVRMHDVVRDVAVWIASSFKDGSKSLVRSGMGLSQISEVKLLESSKRISFMNNKIVALPDFLIKCPKASTLFLQGNSSLRRVPEIFLEGFSAISVLNLSQTSIQLLPHSLTQLSELCALLLRDCNRLEEIPHLGDLGKLQLLDLRATKIRSLPEGVEALRNIRQIKLSRTPYQKNIQDRLVSKLLGPEFVDMTECTYQWNVKGEELTTLVLGCLNPIVSALVWWDSMPHLDHEDRFWMGKLRGFQIFIGSGADENDFPIKYDEWKVILSNIELSEKTIAGLFSNARNLVLNSCANVEWMFRHAYHFLGLKSLVIESCFGLRPFGGGRSSYPFHSMRNLEELYIHGNNELEYVWLLSELGRLPRLKSIEVSHCSELVSIFPHFSWPLENLEELKVSSCEKLKELFQDYSDMTPPRDSIIPNLKRIELKNLASLTTISGEAESWSGLEKLEVINCNLVTSLPLTSLNLKNITEIRGEQEWWNKLFWGDSHSKRILQPYFKPSVTDL